MSAKEDSRIDFETEMSYLKRRYPKCAYALRRIYRWRVLYWIAGFLFSVVRWVIELVAGSQN